MLRNRILSLVGVFMLMVVSVNGQILKDLAKYNCQYGEVKNLPLAAKEGIMISLSPIEAQKYISEVSTVETASCVEEKDVKRFTKKARKLIKKEKAPLVHIIKNEELIVEFYAKEGEIIMLTLLSDNDFAGISVIK